MAWNAVGGTWRPVGGSVGGLNSGAPPPGIPTPADIFGAGLTVWTRSGAGFFTDTAGSTPADPTDAVARWSDQSGGSFHATQSDASRRPLLDATGKFLEFDGVDDLLGPDSRPNAPDRVYAFRANLSGAATLQIIFVHQGLTSEAQIRVTGTDVRVWMRDGAGTLFNPTASVPTAFGAWRTFILHAPSTGFEVFVDGASVLSGAYGTPVSATGNTNFDLSHPSFPVDGAIAEFVYARSPLTPAMRADLEAYMAGRETA